MLEVTLSNRGSAFFVMKLLRFGLHNILFFFAFREKGPVFNRKKNLHKKQPHIIGHCLIGWLVVSLVTAQQFNNKVYEVYDKQGKSCL